MPQGEPRDLRNDGVPTRAPRQPPIKPATFMYPFLIALGVVVGALGALIYFGAVDGDWRGGFHFLRIKPLDLEHAIHFFEALNELGEVVGVVDENHNLAFEKAVIGGDGDRAHIHLKAGTDDACNVVDEAHAVGAFEADTGEESEFELVGPFARTIRLP